MFYIEEEGTKVSVPSKVKPVSGGPLEFEGKLTPAKGKN